MKLPASSRLSETTAERLRVAALLAPAGFVLQDRRSALPPARPEAPLLAVVPVERTGRLTAAQRAFREQWAGAKRVPVRQQ